MGLMKARVPGRMEVYTNADSHIVAIVDYAHNRMSFETLFRLFKRSTPAAGWSPCSAVRGKRPWTAGGTWGRSPAAAPTWWC